MDPIFGKGLDKVIEGASEGPIKTLNLTWDLIFGSYHTWINKIQHKREIDLNEFKKNIESNLKDIPDENLKEPNISLLGPAIEASKFYIDEKVIRNLFSNLISSSMDNRKNEDIHHSFVEIIKQMSGDDAILFEHLSKKEIIPAVTYKAVRNSKGDSITLSDGVIKDSPLSYRDTEMSLVNLKRVGLINIDIGINSFTDEKLYEAFNEPVMINTFIDRFYNKEQERYSKLFKQIETFGFSVLAKDNNLSIDQIYNLCKPSSIEFSKGTIHITTFGQAFVNCCIN